MYTTKRVTPIFRMFDETKAKAFYIDYLGFQVDWEHRYEPGMPLYMQISLGETLIHLTEHHGDCTPGSAVRIEVAGIEALHRTLQAKPYAFARPGLEKTPWHSKEVSVTDPSGNRLTFFESLP